MKHYKKKVYPLFGPGIISKLVPLPNIGKLGYILGYKNYFFNEITILVC